MKEKKLSAKTASHPAGTPRKITMIGGKYVKSSIVISVAQKISQNPRNPARAAAIETIRMLATLAPPDRATRLLILQFLADALLDVKQHGGGRQGCLEADPPFPPEEL